MLSLAESSLAACQVRVFVILHGITEPNQMQNNTQSLRDLTEEALAFYLKANGIYIKAHAA